MSLRKVFRIDKQSHLTKHTLEQFFLNICQIKFVWLGPKGGGVEGGGANIVPFATLSSL